MLVKRGDVIDLLATSNLFTLSTNEQARKTIRMGFQLLRDPKRRTDEQQEALANAMSLGGLRKKKSSPGDKPDFDLPSLITIGPDENGTAEENVVRFLNKYKENLQGSRPEDIEVMVINAHVAKGLEFDRVRIGNDFKQPGKKSESETIVEVS